MKPKDSLTRPTTCGICGMKMYYAGDKRHEPEVQVSVTGGLGAWKPGYYIHERCWNGLQTNQIVISFMRGLTTRGIARKHGITKKQVEEILRGYKRQHA